MAASLNPDSAERYSIPRLRRSAAFYLAGKGITAPLGLAVFLLVSARLARPEFALYAWLIALGQLSQQLSFVGINWVALHWVPYYRSRGDARSYRTFLLVLVGLRLALIGAMVGAYFIVAPQLVTAFGQTDWVFPLRLYLAVMAGELAVEFVRTSVFEPLLEQGFAQSNVLLQHLVFLALLLAFIAGGSALSIEQVIYAKGTAVWIALLAALAQLAYLLRRPVTVRADERPPDRRFLLRFALDNYAQDVLRMTAGGPLMTMLASRLIGVAALAEFGFAQNLTAYCDRFLPAQLFLGLLRPRVIAAYAEDRDPAELRRRVGLILKISSCALAAVTAVVVAVGRPALGLLAGGRYASAYGLLLTFLLWLALISIQRMLAVLTNVLGHSELLRRASVSSLLVVPVAAALVYAGAGAYGLVLGMIAGEIVFVWLVSSGLRAAGHPVALDARGYGALAGATLAAALVGHLAARALPGLWSVPLGVAVTSTSFLAAVRLLRPFTSEERRSIESLLGRKAFLL